MPGVSAGDGAVRRGAELLALSVWLAGPPMTCSQCGGQSNTDTALCSWHVQMDDWAAANRVFCDFLHRGVAPPPVAFADVVDTFWTDVA